MPNKRTSDQAAGVPEEQGSYSSEAPPPLIDLTQTRQEINDIRETQQQAFNEINASLASLKRRKIEKKPKKKKKKSKKDSSSEEDSNSSDSSDSDSESESKTNYPFKNLESQLMTLLGNRWADTKLQEVYNLVAVSELALKKYSRKDIAKVFATVKKLIKDQDEGEGDFYPKIQKLLKKKFKKVKSVEELMKKQRQQRGAGRSFQAPPIATAKRSVSHDGKYCGHCSNSGLSATCWNLHPELRPGQQGPARTTTTTNGAGASSSSSSTTNGAG